MTYVAKNRHGTYEFRRAIPSALRPHMPAPWTDKAVWRKSLATKYPREARELVGEVLATCSADFVQAERRIREDAVPVLRQSRAIDPPTTASARGPRLSEALQTWREGGGAAGAKKPTAGTAYEATFTVRRFIEWHGDLPIVDITKEKARDFRDALTKVPTRLKGEDRGKTLRELLNGDSSAGPRTHAVTINKALNLLSAIVSNAERNGEFDGISGFVNPFGRSLKLRIDARAENARQPFSTTDLNKIFKTPVFAAGERPLAGGGHAAFWLPVIALLSGARLGEIAQLRIADLRLDTDSAIWYFDIGIEGDRRVKTASSLRKVPMHPTLEAVGLLRYRKSLLDSGASPEMSLWPGVQSKVDGQKAAAWSKWFGRFLRGDARVRDKDKVFHSFRHTFKRMARDAGISEEMHDAITGHHGGGVGRSYGAGFGLKTMAAAMEKLEVPECVANLRWVPRQSARQSLPGQVR